MSRQELVNADSYSYTGYPPPPPYSSQGNYPTAPPKEEGGYASYPAPQYEQYPAQQPANYPHQAGQGQVYSTNTIQPEPIVDLEASSAFVGNSFSDKKIRHAFIRKVYLILMVQLAFTVGIVCLFIFCVPKKADRNSFLSALCEPIKQFVRANMAFYYVSYAIFLVTYIVLVCIPSVRRKYPGNFICLIIFTLALTYMTATISSFHDTKIVLVALGITAAVCLAVTIFAIQTKIDFTLCSGLIFAFFMVVFFFGIAVFITFLATGPSFSANIMYCVYGGLVALLFSLFLIFDTQSVVGGRKYNLSEEEYVYGALQLYIDVVQIFLALLSVFGASNN